MHDSRRIERIAAEWLARRDAGELHAAAERELEAWLAAATRHRVAYLRLQAAWCETGRLQALAAGLPRGAVPPRPTWQPLASPHAGAGAPPAPEPVGVTATTPARRWRRLRWRLVGVAAVAALALAGMLLWTGWLADEVTRATYASVVGEVRDVVLADGSVVTLSSDSRIEVAFDRGSRRITLDRGEAYFDVAHDTARPFEVAAGLRRVVAVGTRFAVWRNSGTLRVVVTEGAVRLGMAADEAGAIAPVSLLPAGSVATVGPEGVLVRSLPRAEAERYLEWRGGFLAFDDTPLKVAVAEFNRFNARQFEIADARVGRLRVGGNFRWGNAEGFANLLELGFPVRAERLPDRIVLHAR